MSGNQSEVYRLAKIGLFTIMYDTLNYSEDSLWAWQSRLWTYESDLRLAFEFANLGFMDKYNSVISQINQRYTLSPEQQTEIAQISEIVTIVNGSDAESLSESQKQNLLIIANFDNISGAISKGILSKSGYSFPLYSCSLPVCLAARGYYEEQKTVESGPIHCSIFPNPTTGILNIKFEQSTQALLFGKITDLLGREIDEFEVPANSTDFILDLSRHSSGLYFWSLNNGKTQRMSGKIILIK